MPLIKEVIEALELMAPLSWQEDFDNSGVQVGDVSQPATAALLCLDVTEAVIDEAITLGCNLIISHHPIAFRPFKSLTGVNYVQRCIMRACKHDIVIYAAHTNIDNAKGGVNYELARMLGLENVSTLCPTSEENVGGGAIGSLPTPMSEMDFLIQIKERLGLERLNHSPLRGRMINRVALCGGSGSFMMRDAIRQEADIFITGEAKYNDYYDAEEHILLAVAGHYETEVCTKSLFNKIISEKFPTFALHFSEVNSNPVKYL